MNWLNKIKITPFTQLSWVSLEAAEVWEPTIIRCREQIEELNTTINFLANKTKDFNELIVTPDCCGKKNYSEVSLPIFGLPERYYIINPFLRSIGLSFIDYIPCSTICSAATWAATKKALLLSEVDRKRMSTFLSMPIEYRAYRGIAIIKTPIFYIKTNGPLIAEEKIIQLLGSFVPKEAARGVGFPFDFGGKRD